MTTINEFKNYCENLNNECKRVEMEDKELINEKEAAQAIYIIKNMRIGGVGDAFLYAASLNLLNTYVKQCTPFKKAGGYFFKRFVGNILDFAKDKPQGIDFELQYDDGMNLALVEICGVQFSFHNVNGEKIKGLRAVDKQKARLKWDGIRKQKCAETVFRAAMENNYDRTNRLVNGGNFLDECKRIEEEYRCGEILSMCG